jgi:hypothetical protein
MYADPVQGLQSSKIVVWREPPLDDARSDAMTHELGCRE